MVWKSGAYGRKVKTKGGNKQKGEGEGKKEKGGGGADRHVVLTGQYPCYGKMHSTGCRTGRQCVLLRTGTLLATFPATLPNICGDKLLIVTTLLR